MEINVAQLLKSPIGSVREYEVDEDIDIPDEGTSCEVKGKVGLTRTDSSILARGKLTTRVELTCSRCLSPLRCPLNVKIEEEYYPTIDIVTGARLAPLEDAEHFTIDERHILDLTEAIRQTVVVSIPMKPLCKDDCTGLCPVCGRNLNQGDCGCPPREADARWAVLRNLKLPDTEKGN
jgi:uncharacterized protein